MNYSRNRRAVITKCSPTLRRFAFASVATVALAIVPLSAVGASGTIGSVQVSTKTLSAGGGTITVSAIPPVSGTCSVVVTPTQPDVPASTSCTASARVSFTFRISGNTSGAHRTIKVAVKLCESGLCKTSPTVSVGEGALKVATVTSSSPPLGSASVAAVSCPTTSFCLLIDSAGSTYTLASTHKWTKSSFDFKTVPSSLSCASTTLCVAADIDGDGYVYNGKTWTGTMSMAPTAASVATNCPKPQDCEVLWSVSNAGTGLSGFSNYAFNTDGGGWTLRGGSLSTGGSFATSGDVTAISCVANPADATDPICYGVDSSGDLIWFNHDDEQPKEIFSSVQTSIACTSSSGYCVTMAPGGPAFQTPLNTSTLAARSIPMSTGDKTMRSIACATAEICVMSGPNSLQLLFEDKYPEHGDVDFGSPIVSLSAAGAGALTVVIPGQAFTTMTVGKSRDMQGHVTLIR
jgi:hypothetical protein